MCSALHCGEKKHRDLLRAFWQQISVLWGALRCMTRVLREIVTLSGNLRAESLNSFALLALGLQRRFQRAKPFGKGAAEGVQVLHAFLRRQSEEILDDGG